MKGKRTFPAVSAGGNPLWPITVNDGYQLRLIRHSRGLVDIGLTPYRKLMSL